MNNDALNNTHEPSLGGRRVLRFEFSSTLVEQVTAFAKLHRYDDRKTYKEAWVEWLAHDVIATLIKNEFARLSALGYKGDIADKLFKSGRYYFRGKGGEDKANDKANDKAKDKANDKANDKADNNTNRKYVLLNRQLLDIMDDHIECGLRSIGAYTPASGFAEFCKLNLNSYSSEVTRLSELMPTGEAVYDKIKKTYKNRYFMMTKLGQTTRPSHFI